jgi:phosphopantothenoylcysteine decarboxylase/phosphopantothenate--cysteine ligase
MAAAPADFAAAAPARAKIKKSTLGDSLALTRTDDILATTRGSRSTSCVTVGFALETGDARNEARRKLADKGLDFIVANDALEDGAGFMVDTNRVTIVHADGREEALPLQHKTQVADELLDRVEVLLRGR